MSTEPDTDKVGSDGLTAGERDELGALALTGLWAVPVAVVQVAVILWLVGVVTGWRLPASPLTGLIVCWLWVNGAAVAAAAWLWRRGSLTTVSGRLLRGRRARLSMLAWLGTSLALFVFPDLTRMVLADFREWLGR